MGYSTSFIGSFSITPTLSLADYNLLNAIADADTRERGFPVPAPPYPSEYCKWVPTKDGNALEWNGQEKFYCYVEWLEWLIDEVFNPRGYELNGTVQFFAGELDDRGVIVIANNVVEQKMLVSLQEHDELHSLPPGVYVVRAAGDRNVWQKAFEQVSNDPDAWEKLQKEQS